MHTDGPVVIALDGSPHSEQTLRWGLAEASLREADVILARATREPRDVVNWTWYPIVGEDLELDPEAKQYLADLLERESVRNPELTIESALLHGPEVSELRRLSEDAQLLVVGAHGRAGRLRIGSVSGHLAAHARCPVAVVRSDAAPARDRVPVVVGVDGSLASIAAARAAAREASMRRGPLVVVHARPTSANPYGRGTPVPVPGDGRIDENDPIHRAAREVAELLRGEHPGLDVRLSVVDDEPAHALVAAAKDAQLLVVGSRGLGAFRGMLLGAVSNDVVRESATTVLVMHDAEVG